MPFTAQDRIEAFLLALKRYYQPSDDEIRAVEWCLKLAGEDGDDHIPKAWMDYLRARRDAL
jgi:hypothetical protein